MKALILLVEGLVEEIVYSSILEKLYGGKQVTCENMPRPLRELITPITTYIEERAKCYTLCYTLERGDLITIVDCKGYENLKNTIRLLLDKQKDLLIKVLKQLDLRIAIAADRDKKPAESIRGLLSSMGFQVTEGDVLTIEFSGGAKLAIHIVEQGGEGGTATGEVEDELRKLVEAVKPELQHIAEKIEEIYKPLTDKQKLLIYLALLEREPKIRELYEILRREVIATASRDTIEQNLESLVKNLEKALK